MKSEYFQILILSLVYNIIYFCSLVFATGYGIGLKLDDNQFIAYCLIAITSLICIIAFKINQRKQRKIIVKLIGLSTGLFLILFLSGIVGSNEAMFLFVIPIFGLPIFIFLFIAHYLTFAD